MTPEQLYAIIGSNVAAVIVVGGLVGTFFWRTATRLDRRIDNDKATADADRRAFEQRIANDKAAADADRRAFQDAMNDFRKEMQRLAERQSHVEGTRAALGD